MALQRRGNHFFGDNQADIRVELQRCSQTGYPAEHFADALCSCGGRLFRLALDENEGAAVRTCSACQAEHAIGDSAEYLDEAELEECACPCGHEEFEITVGVALYQGSDDVKWLYLGCRCPHCGLTAPYGDWKNAFSGYQQLLAQI